MIFPPKPGNPSQVTRNSVSFRACPQHNFKLSKSKERTCRNTSSLHNRRFMSQARRTRHLLEARNECEAQDERWRKIKLYFSPPLAWLIKRLLCRLEVFLQVLSLLFFLLQGLLQGGKFGNNELIKETFVFEIFWGILYHSESKTVMNVVHSQSAYVCPDQYKYINQIKQEGRFCEKFIYFFLPKQRPKTEAIEYFVTVC